MQYPRLCAIAVALVCANAACSESDTASQSDDVAADPTTPNAPTPNAMGPAPQAPQSPTPAGPEPPASGGAPDAPGQPPAEQPGPGEQPPAMQPPAEMTPVAGAGGDTPTTMPPPGANCLQGSGDFNGDGPYSVGQTDVSIGAQGMYTIFYPQPLEDDCPHPIVAWGNGTAVTGSAVYAFYHQHAATWGVVTIASHDPNTGSGMFHTAGLDYLLAQNEDASSMFYQKLSPRAGVSGHSQGGGGANAGASHPNVEAEVNVQGAFGRAPAGVAFLCLTGTEDIAIMGCRSSVNGTDMPALYANWQGGTHTGTATLGGFIAGDQGSLQYRRLSTAWFRCFLADDAGACALFEGGASCQVCTEPGWAEIEMRNY